MMFGTRALLDQHMRDCREDRERTAEQFGSTSVKLDKLEDKFERYMSSQQQQHEENQDKLDSVKRLIYMAMGAVTVIGLLFSPPGQALMRVLLRNG